MEWLSNSIYKSIHSNEFGDVCYSELWVQLDEKHIYVLHCCLIYWSKGIRLNVCQEVDLESCLMEFFHALKSCNEESPILNKDLRSRHYVPVLCLFISLTKRTLGNVVWHETSGTGFVGSLCHCIWEVLQSQPSCRRQHSNEVINNLQQLLRERDLICWARATSDSAVTEQTAPK